MKLRLEQVVPWGRSRAEYERMFNLSAADLQGRILDVAGGPASFNAEMAQQGKSVVSCDPIYQFSADEIRSRIDATYPTIVEKLESAPENFVWTNFRSPEDVAQTRMKAMQQFLADFEAGLHQQRYRCDELPHLNFDRAAFDLALCSHLLFTYSEHLSLAFHISSVLEMCRVATEVRVFPLLMNMTGEVSEFVQPVIQAVQEEGWIATIEPVAYEFQRGGNEMLSVRRRDEG